MLVCNVSLRPRRVAISAGLTEVASATAATATGNIIFATLVDDPASVADRVDAYSGEIMREAASANAAVTAGLTYGVGIVEDTIAAAALQDGHIIGVVVGALVEAATAQATVSATVAAVYTTTGAIAVGPLFAIDATLPRSSVTIIDVGR